jgi:16S rRNA (adenine1518-N6/adenine1519-N6)-dimethyltransferase
MKRPTDDRARAKRSLGQNFLSDPNYIARIIAAVDPLPADTIIEIGPGRGALTEKLVESGAEVIAIELDREMIEPLRTKFSGHGMFRVIEQNALTVDFADPAIFPEPAKLVANLPYYISTAILQRLADQRDNLSSLVLMFQREVVNRITAKPGSSDRGFLTVLAEAAFRIEKLFDVPPTAFRPVPKVWSSVVRLTPNPKIESESSLRDLLSVAFAQKRKTIANNLKSRFPDHASALAAAGIEPHRRAESLILEEWFRLNDALLQTRANQRSPQR